MRTVLHNYISGHAYEHLLLKLLVYMSFVFTPVAAALVWMGVFVFIDLITGIWKARKNAEPITSKRLGNTITKVVMYFLAIITSQVMDAIFFHQSFLPFTIAQLAIGFFSFTEFKSIMENISAILGADVWKYLRSKIDNLRDAK